MGKRKPEDSLSYIRYHGDPKEGEAQADVLKENEVQCKLCGFRIVTTSTR
jgi:hypothetical protein